MVKPIAAMDGIFKSVCNGKQQSIAADFYLIGNSQKFLPVPNSEKSKKQ